MAGVIHLSSRRGIVSRNSLNLNITQDKGLIAILKYVAFFQFFVTGFINQYFGLIFTDCLNGLQIQMIGMFMCNKYHICFGERLVIGIL